MDGSPSKGNSCGLWCRYELYLPMHEMWKEYARKLVHNCNDAMMQARLLTADLHGVMIAVVESKSTSYMGTNGIMVRETENTFGIMTIKDKLRGMVLDKVSMVLLFAAFQVPSMKGRGDLIVVSRF
jgi:ribonuclease P protein subunit POP4